jgi:hypothetical protein
MFRVQQLCRVSRGTVDFWVESGLLKTYCPPLRNLVKRRRFVTNVVLEKFLIEQGFPEEFLEELRAECGRTLKDDGTPFKDGPTECTEPDGIVHGTPVEQVA